jgi:hypothetical protein
MFSHCVFSRFFLHTLLAHSSYSSCTLFLHTLLTYSSCALSYII